jgi:hypothetical protein
MSAEQEQNFLSAERAEGIADLRREEYSEQQNEGFLRSKIDALKADLPRLSFGLTVSWM